MANEQSALTEAFFYILLSLASPLHGYGIMQKTEEMSGGRLRLAPGTLYGALQTLEGRGWIAEEQNPADSRRREYNITPAGTAALRAEVARLREMVNNAEAILWGMEQ